MCEPGGEQDRDWPAVVAVQCRLDREGGTKLFTDLVMSTKNDKIFQESIQLAICLLEGGNTEIQVTRALKIIRMGLLETSHWAFVSSTCGQNSRPAVFPWKDHRDDVRVTSFSFPQNSFYKLMMGDNKSEKFFKVLHDRMKEAQTDIKATVSVNVGEMTYKANEKELETGKARTF